MTPNSILGIQADTSNIKVEFVDKVDLFVEPFHTSKTSLPVHVH